MRRQRQRLELWGQKPLEAQKRQKEGFSPSVSWGKGKMACSAAEYILLALAPQNEQGQYQEASVVLYLCALRIQQHLVSGFYRTVREKNFYYFKLPTLRYFVTAAGGSWYRQVIKNNNAVNACVSTILLKKQNIAIIFKVPWVTPSDITPIPSPKRDSHHLNFMSIVFLP